MKKIIIAIYLIAISLLGVAQNNQKWNQFSFRAGYDQATKANYAKYANGKLNGFNVGISYDKYWKWYGIGVDVDLMKNAAPTYIKEAEMIDSIRRRSGNFFQHNISYTIANSNKALTRGFVGVGPDFKLQNKKNNLVAELNARAGFTYTNGGALLYTTTATPSATWLPWANHLTRSGLVPTTTSIYGWTFKDDGYSNDILGTIKGQVRVNYYIKPNIGINLTGYYNYYQGSKIKYDYVEYIDPQPASSSWMGLGYWDLMANLKSALAPLTSYGINAGVTYRFGNMSNSTTAKKAKVKSSAAVTVKDELTGQPIIGAAVTLKNANGKTYNAITNTQGVANFEKIEDGVYSAKAEMNAIFTNEQSFSVAKSAGTASLTHNDPRFTVIGKAVNKATSTPEGDVSVSLNNKEKGSIKMATSQSGNGSFSFQLDQNSDYQLVGKKDSYISNIEKVSTKGLTRSQTLYVELEIGVEKVEAGKALVLQNILYDLDKADIRQDASSDLEKLTVFLQDNPNFKVEVASHTDNRGADDYNLKLSLQRAQNVVNYLVGKGISVDRLIAKGYGETMPVNSCTTCTEAEHQQNRRTEFKVIN
jgi:outer membrane protein OmpA-like peptidoglycan-associated protein